MSQGIVCPVCHSSNRSNAKFCAHCGAALTVAPAAPAPQRLQPSALVHNGAYRILRPLSKGGMGMIYLAQDLGAFDRLCVIKEMLDYFDPAKPQEVQEAQQRFEDEARTLARLTHPQIPNLLSYFSERQHNYIVMAYVEGVTLDHFIGQQQATAQVVEYGIQTCEILEYLGGLKPPVVHHDLKPANIIVDNATKSAWLVDFGVAKARLAKQQNGQVGVKKSSIFGTTGYAPPEQYQSQSEPKSDVYALAATLYHVLTGDDPQNHPFDFPQVAMLPAGFSGALSAALEQDVRRRCTAAELRAALEKALRTPASRKASSAPLPAVSAHESYAVIVPRPVTDAVRPQVVKLLSATRGLAAVDAEVLTWQTLACYLRGVDAIQSQDMVRQLKALGVTAQQVVTSQLHSWRQTLTAGEQKALVGNGEIAVLDKRFPQDRICHCHRCHHQWTTQAREQTRLREVCSRCGQQWFPHRIFRCTVCGHEFTHSDLTTPTARLFVACPACKSDAWRPGQLPHFSRRSYALDIGSTPAGAQIARTVMLQVAPSSANVVGRAVAAAPWLIAAPLLQGNQLALTIDTHALPVRRRHSAVVDIIANAGVAQIAVDIYVESPPILTVTPPSLDFGVVRANETRSLTLEVRNTGEQVLSGQITCADGWLTVDKPAFTANQYTVRCTVSGDRLPKAGVNTTTLTITSNGGALSVPVRAEGLPPTLNVTPLRLDFEIARQRTPAPQPLVIENIGVGLLTGALHSDAPWLSIRDTTVHANYLETEVAVDAIALEPGQTVASAVHIVTNGGVTDVPVTVRMAARGMLEWLVTAEGLTILLVLSIVVIAAWMGMRRGEPGPSVRPTPVVPAAALSVSQATPTPRDYIATREPLVALPPATVTPTASPTPTPPATLTPAPSATTSLQFLERLRTLRAQGATQTAVADATVTTVTRAAPPTIAPPQRVPPSAQCSDPRAVITAPLPGQTLRGNVPVYGTAEHAAFRYYKIEIATPQAGEERFSFVTDSDTPVAAGLLAVIDTARFPNGAYILQLTVVDRSGNFPAPCQVVVKFEN